MGLYWFKNIFTFSVASTSIVETLDIHGCNPRALVPPTDYINLVLARACASALSSSHAKCQVNSLNGKIYMKISFLALHMWLGDPGCFLWSQRWFSFGFHWNILLILVLCLDAIWIENAVNYFYKESRKKEKVTFGHNFNLQMKKEHWFTLGDDRCQY